MNNNAISPNTFLKAFYSETVLVKAKAAFDGFYLENNTQIKSIVGVYKWHDTGFLVHSPIILPEYTKKAIVRVMVAPGIIAPKHVAFCNMNAVNGTEYTYVLEEPPATYGFTLSAGVKGFALLEGTEIEVTGVAEIRKLLFFNNLTNGATLYNADPINFLLNITLFK